MPRNRYAKAHERSRFVVARRRVFPITLIYLSKTVRRCLLFRAMPRAPRHARSVRAAAVVEARRRSSVREKRRSKTIPRSCDPKLINQKEICQELSVPPGRLITGDKRKSLFPAGAAAQRRRQQRHVSARSSPPLPPRLSHRTRETSSLRQRQRLTPPCRHAEPCRSTSPMPRRPCRRHKPCRQTPYRDPEKAGRMVSVWCGAQCMWGSVW